MKLLGALGALTALWATAGLLASQAPASGLPLSRPVSPSSRSPASSTPTLISSRAARNIKRKTSQHPNQVAKLRSPVEAASNQSDLNALPSETSSLWSAPLDPSSLSGRLKRLQSDEQNTNQHPTPIISARSSEDSATSGRSHDDATTLGHSTLFDDEQAPDERTTPRVPDGNQTSQQVFGKDQPHYLSGELSTPNQNEQFFQPGELNDKSQSVPLEHLQFSLADPPTGTTTGGRRQVLQSDVRPTDERLAQFGYHQQQGADPIPLDYSVSLNSSAQSPLAYTTLGGQSPAPPLYYGPPEPPPRPNRHQRYNQMSIADANELIQRHQLLLDAQAQQQLRLLEQQNAHRRQSAGENLPPNNPSLLAGNNQLLRRPVAASRVSQPYQSLVYLYPPSARPANRGHNLVHYQTALAGPARRQLFPVRSSTLSASQLVAQHQSANNNYLPTGVNRSNNNQEAPRRKWQLSAQRPTSHTATQKRALLNGVLKPATSNRYYYTPTYLSPVGLAAPAVSSLYAPATLAVPLPTAVPHVVYAATPTPTQYQAQNFAESSPQVALPGDVHSQRPTVGPLLLKPSWQSARATGGYAAEETRATVDQLDSEPDPMRIVRRKNPASGAASQMPEWLGSSLEDLFYLPESHRRQFNKAVGARALQHLISQSQTPIEEPPSLALQLQTNNFAQNDIEHPFGSGAESALDSGRRSLAGTDLMPTQYQLPTPLGSSPQPFEVYPTNQQQLHGFQLNVESQLARLAGQHNPLLVDPIRNSPLLASASEFNPNHLLMFASPAGFMAPAGSMRHPEYNQPSVENQDDNQAAATENKLSGKNKKRSSEFFASAGQLLLSALPLLLAPTLGLMFASSPAPVARYHAPNPLGSSPASQPYINSLASGLVSNATPNPQLFTPTPLGYNMNSSSSPSATSRPSLANRTSGAKPAGKSNSTTHAPQRGHTTMILTTLSPPPFAPTESVEADLNQTNTTLMDPSTASPTILLLTEEASLSENGRRRNHYDIGYEGVDFDAQFASLPKIQQSQNSTLHWTSSANHRRQIEHRDKYQHKYSQVPQYNASSELADAEPNEDDQSGRLYPVSTWPSMRRRTVSLVTSSGNKTLLDATEKYSQLLRPQVNNSRRSTTMRPRVSTVIYDELDEEQPMFGAINDTSRRDQITNQTSERDLQPIELTMRLRRPDNNSSSHDTESILANNRLKRSVNETGAELPVAPAEKESLNKTMPARIVVRRRLRRRRRKGDNSSETVEQNLLEPLQVAQSRQNKAQYQESLDGDSSLRSKTAQVITTMIEQLEDDAGEPANNQNQSSAPIEADDHEPPSPSVDETEEPNELPSSGQSLVGKKKKKKKLHRSRVLNEDYSPSRYAAAASDNEETSQSNDQYPNDKQQSNGSEAPEGGLAAGGRGRLPPVPTPIEVISTKIKLFAPSRTNGTFNQETAADRRGFSSAARQGARQLRPSRQQQVLVLNEDTKQALANLGNLLMKETTQMEQSDQLGPRLTNRRSPPPNQYSMHPPVEPRSQNDSWRKRRQQQQQQQTHRPWNQKQSARYHSLNVEGSATEHSLTRTTPFPYGYLEATLGPRSYHRNQPPRDYGGAQQFSSSAGSMHIKPMHERSNLLEPEPYGGAGLNEEQMANDYRNGHAYVTQAPTSHMPDRHYSHDHHHAYSYQQQQQPSNYSDRRHEQRIQPYLPPPRPHYHGSDYFQSPFSHPPPPPPPPPTQAPVYSYEVRGQTPHQHDSYGSRHQPNYSTTTYAPSSPPFSSYQHQFAPSHGYASATSTPHHPHDDYGDGPPRYPRDRPLDMGPYVAPPPRAHYHSNEYVAPPVAKPSYESRPGHAHHYDPMPYNQAVSQPAPASLVSATNIDKGISENLQKIHFSDSDRDKLMASYLTCDGLLNDNDHCLERLSCEFSDPRNIEKANKLDRAVSSILLGHILINTYIPDQFKVRLKSASFFGYTQSGKCSRFVCNKLAKPLGPQSGNPAQSD